MGKLTLYVFGPGFGESQVVALPDGKWMVVDSCVHRGVNLPLELLRHFDAPAINLLVVTHPDLDHYKGLPELIAAFKVERLWRYPGFHTAREIILSLERGETDNKSLRELRRMQDAMLPLMRSASGREAAYDTRLLPEPKDYRIHCIAPCPQEKVHETERLGALFKRVEQGKKLTKDEKRWLMGKANRLSLAVVIWWDNIGILLGGDVEHEDGTPDRGWPGILAVMNEDETLGLVQGLRIVKIPHHGSKGAFCEQAWKHHASKGPIEIAVSTRFNKSANPPPHPSGLDKLIPYAQQLAITSPPGDFSPVITAGWLPVSHASGPGDAACVAITLAPEPPSSLDLSAQAALFASPMTVPPNAG
ncbi:MBL fold metallo-hydrolase [Sorangium sp. So ce327]|jgi:hypothetical protein|uniref:MBL fold metallo-hydrolase n=1 Tax=Sorangium sp. So ce327 TaxID=3133301 RepID=UPI003F5F0B9E